MWDVLSDKTVEQFLELLASFWCGVRIGLWNSENELIFSVQFVQNSGKLLLQEDQAQLQVDDRLLGGREYCDPHPLSRGGVDTLQWMNWKRNWCQNDLTQWCKTANFGQRSECLHCMATASLSTTAATANSGSNTATTFSKQTHRWKMWWCYSLWLLGAES